MKITVFAGTGDGRELSVYLANLGAEVTVSVATEYGAELMACSGVTVHEGRLDYEQMRSLIHGSSCVIDATHPYAAEASRNIFSACKSEDKEYIRLIRPESHCSGAVYVENIEDAVRYLEDTTGNIFVSTGSNELIKFERIGSRVTARVLDTEEIHRRCRNMKINRIIYKKPPFDLKDNIEDFKGCRYLVTKDGGTAGGIIEKLKAAELLSMKIIIIKRPCIGSNGYTIEDIKRLFFSRLKGIG